MRTQPPRAILATLPVFTSVVVMLVALVAGAFAPVERVSDGVLAALWGDGPLTTSVVVIELDEAAVERWGPPPWAPTIWAEIADGLGAAGVDEVVLVEDPRRLLGAGAPIPSEGARLLLPGVDAPPAPLTGRPGLEVTWTPDPRGLGASAAGSAWCAWARCPVGSPMTTPLRATRLPDLVRLRLSALTSGHLRARVDDSALVFLGAPTGSSWASSLAVGEPTALLSRTDAVALGAATLRSAPPRPTVPLQILLPLAILLVLVGALVAHVEPWVPAEAWIAILPLAIVAGAGLLAVLGVVMVPVPPLACAAMLGALAETLRLRSRMAGFFRRLGHRLAVTDSGVPREANPTPQAMLQQLASLTWNHLPTDRMLYVHRNGREAEVIGGFGLATDDVGVELSASRLRRLATAGRCDEIALDGRMAIAVVEVPRHGEAVGWWMVAWDQSDEGPTAERLADLARWVSDEAPVRPEVHPFARLLRTDRELDRLEQAFERSDRASARQRLLLRTVRTPLAVADRAGTIVFQNAAFSAMLGDAHPRSLRQLVYEANGAVGLSRRMRDLFESGAPLEVAWVDRGVRLRASPAADGARSGVLITVEPIRTVDAEDAPLAAK